MISFSYRLFGRGTAECFLKVGTQDISLTASYLSDALGDMVDAVVRMLQGTPYGKVLFEEEPGEYRWLFEVTGTD